MDAGPIGADTLPQHRITERLYAEFGEALQVLKAVFVPGESVLVAEAIRDAIDRAFMAAPQLHR
jgi:hypothetical protein